MFWQHIQQEISKHTGEDFKIENRQSIGGGSINQAFRISSQDTSYFVKTNRKQLAYMFEAEAVALDALYQASCIKVPQPIATGIHGHESYFIMQWINFSGQPNATEFARNLACMHACIKDQFGFDIDNTIGSTPQINQWSSDWIDFWKKQRLGYQLGLIRKNGFGQRLYDHGLILLDKTEMFFSDYQPEASLLHGDLWSGNWAADDQGKPVIFDPASYYGDREADLAMMELFGHPGSRFLDAYREAYALDQGYRVRKNFYNLYHILNHANMFGGSYALQAEKMIEALLAEVR